MQRESENTMEKFIEMYAEYESIRSSYIGEKTDWKEVYKRLKILENNISKINIRDSKNMPFYYWIKRKLTNEVSDELIRIGKKCLD